MAEQENLTSGSPWERHISLSILGEHAPRPLDPSTVVVEQALGARRLAATEGIAVDAVDRDAHFIVAIKRDHREAHITLLPTTSCCVVEAPHVHAVDPNDWYEWDTLSASGYLRWEWSQLSHMPFVTTHSDPIIHIWKETQEVRNLWRVWAQLTHLPTKTPRKEAQEVRNLRRGRSQLTNL